MSVFKKSLTPKKRQKMQHKQSKKYKKAKDSGGTASVTCRRN